MMSEWASHPGGNSSEFKVLLVEDDYVNRYSTLRQLEIKGYRVLAVEDGQSALDALREERFGVVLMDIQMPLKDGMETTLDIRSGKAGEENRDIPIIALTAYAMTGDKERFLETGMNAYLAKPIDAAELFLILSMVESGELLTR